MTKVRKSPRLTPRKPAVHIEKPVVEKPVVEKHVVQIDTTEKQARISAVMAKVIIFIWFYKSRFIYV